MAFSSKSIWALPVVTVIAERGLTRTENQKVTRKWSPFYDSSLSLLYLSFASKNAFANGLCLIFKLVIWKRHKNAVKELGHSYCKQSSFPCNNTSYKMGNKRLTNGKVSHDFVDACLRLLIYQVVWSQQCILQNKSKLSWFDQNS